MDIYRLNFGEVRLFKKIYPVFAYLVCLQKGQKVLIDSGASLELNYLMREYKQWAEFCLESDLYTELNKLDFKIDDIDFVIQTHLHHDHVSSLEFLNFDRQKVLVSKQEVQAIPKGKFTVAYNVSYLKDYLTKFTLVDFDEKDVISLTDDIKLVKTANHTKGHMSVVIIEKEKRCFFTGDSFYTSEEIVEYFHGGQSKNSQLLKQGKDSGLYERLKSLFEDKEYSIYFSHCEKVISSKELLKGN